MKEGGIKDNLEKRSCHFLKMGKRSRFRGKEQGLGAEHAKQVVRLTYYVIFIQKSKTNMGLNNWVIPNDQFYRKYSVDLKNEILTEM